MQLVNNEQPNPKPQPPPRIYDVSESFLNPPTSRMREGGLVFELVHLNCSLFSSQEPCDRETVVYCLEDTLATPTGTNPACYIELTLTLLLCPSIHTSLPPLTHTHIHTSPPPSHTHIHTHMQRKFLIRSLTSQYRMLRTCKMTSSDKCKRKRPIHSHFVHGVSSTHEPQYTHKLVMKGKPC